MGSGRASIPGAPAPCIYRALQQVEDLTNGLPGSSSNAEKSLFRVWNTCIRYKDPPPWMLDSNLESTLPAMKFRNGLIKMTNTGTSTCPQPHRYPANWKDKLPKQELRWETCFLSMKYRGLTGALLLCLNIPGAVILVPCCVNPQRQLVNTMWVQPLTVEGPLPTVGQDSDSGLPLPQDPPGGHIIKSRGTGGYVPGGLGLLPMGNRSRRDLRFHLSSTCATQDHSGG